RTTGDCGSQCSESRCGNGSKAELLALQVSKVLIKRETCDGRNSDLSKTALRRRTRDPICDTGALGYQPRIRLKFEVNCPYDHSNKEGKHAPVNHDGVLNFPKNPPKHQHKRERKHHHVEAGKEVGPRAGFFEGMGRVGPKKPPAIGSDLLDWNNRRDRTD